MKPQNIDKSLVFLLCILCLPFIRCNRYSTPFTVEGDISSNRIAGPDYRSRGGHAVVERDSVLALPDGCTITYTLHTPESASDAAWVILGHGFMRSRGRMEGIASHWASWGLNVATLDFCRSTWTDGKHAENAQDMVTLRERLGIDRTIYAGFSAGGLSALIAAVLDTAAIACLGLDLVDSQGLGITASSNLTMSLFGLASAPSSCNAMSNGIAVYQAADQSALLQVEDATHCHFEIPFDPLCSLVCGSGEKTFSQTQIQETILAFSTAFLTWRHGLDPEADRWWSPGGETLRLFADEGRISEIDIETK